ncbi:uncharacterized protein LOC125655619 [Ostrea edulis]|uniref:uncharacterized protein LOC125655619 n=1 Tax=Ostrea edulis TaxID=37623 RepID=UPI0020951C77|nr:uncharacterized protein LOC125655619 [Ostrea edulis]
MGFKCNRLCLILRILFAVYINSIQSSYCYYYYDYSGYWKACYYTYYTYSNSAATAGKIVGYVFAGLFGLIFFLGFLTCMAHLYEKLCAKCNREAVRPAISHIDTAESDPGSQEHAVVNLDPPPQYELTGHSNPR